MANPNPSPETRFTPGRSGNPGGKSSEQIKDEREASAIAAKLRLTMLSTMQEKVDAGTDVLELMTSDALKLFKDSEDRAHGTPKQTSEVSGPGGGDVPHRLTIDFSGKD